MTTPKPQFVDSLVRVTSRLIAVMQQEVDLLRKMDIGGIAALQEDKATLVAAYEDSLHNLSANPDTLRAMEPALKTEMRELAARFDRVVEENSRALNAVRNSN